MALNLASSTRTPNTYHRGTDQIKGWPHGEARAPEYSCHGFGARGMRVSLRSLRDEDKSLVEECNIQVATLGKEGW